MKNKKIYLVGMSLILFALLIVLSAIFIPKIVHKKQMRDLLGAMCAENVAFMTVGDPLYPTLDLLGNKGRSVTLTAEQTLEVKSLLSALAKSGYRISGEEKSVLGKMDLNLRVRNTDGENFNLYFLENSFYFAKENMIVTFQPKNEDAYRVLYETLHAYLAE